MFMTNSKSEATKCSTMDAAFPASGSDGEKLEWVRRTNKLSDDAKLAILYTIDPTFRESVSNHVYSNVR